MFFDTSIVFSPSILFKELVLPRNAIKAKVPTVLIQYTSKIDSFKAGLLFAGMPANGTIQTSKELSVLVTYLHIYCHVYTPLHSQVYWVFQMQHKFIACLVQTSGIWPLKSKNTKTSSESSYDKKRKAKVFGSVRSECVWVCVLSFFCRPPGHVLISFVTSFRAKKSETFSLWLRLLLVANTEHT